MEEEKKKRKHEKISRKKEEKYYNQAKRTVNNLSKDQLVRVLKSETYETSLLEIKCFYCRKLYEIKLSVFKYINLRCSCEKSQKALAHCKFSHKVLSIFLKILYSENYSTNYEGEGFNGIYQQIEVKCPKDHYFLTCIRDFAFNGKRCSHPDHDFVSRTRIQELVQTVFKTSQFELVNREDRLDLDSLISLKCLFCGYVMGINLLSHLYSRSQIDSCIYCRSEPQPKREEKPITEIIEIQDD
jgi:hypothetical protein